jgi:CBS domain containing-hemolysin-like protein
VRKSIINGLKDQSPDALVAFSIRTPVPTVLSSVALESALSSLQADNINAISVVDECGSLVGLPTKQTIAEVNMIMSGTSQLALQIASRVAEIKCAE